MSIIAVLTTKGGAGKSSITVNLGVAAAGKRRRVFAIDCDKKQASVEFWARGLRTSDRPVVRVGEYETVADLISQAQRDNFDFIIIDCPPGGGDLVRRVAGLADHILIPVRPTAFDLDAVRHTVEMLRTTVDESQPEELQARTVLAKAAIVLNGVPTKHSKRLLDDVGGALEECGAGGLDIVGVLSERSAYASAIADGKGVTEDGRDPKAAEEITSLYDNLRARERKRAVPVKGVEDSRTRKRSVR